MQVKGDSSLNKLILLFVFDKMEVPLSENTVLDMCTSSNNWLAYMDFVGTDYVVAINMHADENKRDYVCTRKERG